MNFDFNQVLASLQRMVEDFLTSLPALTLALIVLIAFYFFGKGVKSGVLNLTNKRSISYTSSLVIARLSRLLIIIVGVLVAISIAAPGFGMTELVSLLGVGGVAIGFAFRDILQNFLAGILILLTRPFVVGDQIEVGDYEGTVETIEIRATNLKTYDHRRVVIPNADLFTDSVIVNTAYEARRSYYDVGIGYEADIDGAIETILSAVKEIDAVLDEPSPQAFPIELDSSSVNIRVLWWTHPKKSSVLLTKGQVIKAMKVRLDQAGINIPFPIRTLDLSNLPPQQRSTFTNGANQNPATNTKD